MPEIKASKVQVPGPWGNWEPTRLSFLPHQLPHVLFHPLALQLPANTRRIALEVSFKTSNLTVFFLMFNAALAKRIVTNRCDHWQAKKNSQGTSEWKRTDQRCYWKSLTWMETGYASGGRVAYSILQLVFRYVLDECDACLSSLKLIDIACY